MRRTLLAIGMLLAFAMAPTAVAGTGDGPCDDGREGILCDPWVQCVLGGGEIQLDDNLSCCPKDYNCIDDRRAE